MMRRTDLSWSERESESKKSDMNFWEKNPFNVFLILEKQKLKFPSKEFEDENMKSQAPFNIIRSRFHAQSTEYFQKAH